MRGHAYYMRETTGRLVW